MYLTKFTIFNPKPLLPDINFYTKFEENWLIKFNAQDRDQNLTNSIEFEYPFLGPHHFIATGKLTDFFQDLGKYDVTMTQTMPTIEM